MSDSDIYRKSEKGRSEIATREYRLGMRERALLVMVDDKTTRGTLLLRNAHPSSNDLLDFLLENGFIEVVPEPQPVVPDVVETAPAKPEAPPRVFMMPP